MNTKEYFLILLFFALTGCASLNRGTTSNYSEWIDCLDFPDSDIECSK